MPSVVAKSTWIQAGPCVQLSPRATCEAMVVVCAACRAACSARTLAAMSWVIVVIMNVVEGVELVEELEARLPLTFAGCWLQHSEAEVMPPSALVQCDQGEGRSHNYTFAYAIIKTRTRRSSYLQLAGAPIPHRRCGYRLQAMIDDRSLYLLYLYSWYTREELLYPSQGFAVL